jgi:transcriptional antiterminator RfaH
MFLSLAHQPRPKIQPDPMTFTPDQLFLEEEPLWFCLKTQPKREHVAAAGLRSELRLNCFAPRLRFRRPTRRGPIWFVEAMFPGYIFAEFVYRERHRDVRYAVAVQQIVQFGDQVAVVDAEIVTALRRRTGEEELATLDQEIKVGEPIQITDGPFNGLEAIVTRLLPAKERVCILFDLLNRTVELEAPFSSVIPTRRPQI